MGGPGGVHFTVPLAILLLLVVSGAVVIGLVVVLRRSRRGASRGTDEVERKDYRDDL